jgi:hypothetical protein
MKKGPIASDMDGNQLSNPLTGSLTKSEQVKGSEPGAGITESMKKDES